MPVRRGAQDHTARQRGDPTRVLKFKRNKPLVGEKSLLETGGGSVSSNSVGSQERGRVPPRNTACCGLSSLTIDVHTRAPRVCVQHMCVSVCMLDTCECIRVYV